jgi:hypothetical protein
LNKPPFRIRLRDVTLDDADLRDAWSADPASRSEFNECDLPPDAVPRDVVA